MAEMHGKEGSVKVSTNQVAHTNDWTIDVGIGAPETTTHGDDWKSFIPGLAEWSGSFSMSYDYSDTNGQKAVQDVIIAASPAGTLATMRFYLSGSNYLDGTVIFTGMSIDTPVDGVVSATISFQGSGALSYN